ncbi:MAG: hypothetical protein Q8O84_04085, partial [Nanoarchaeota archaeon]|nr:hypothetical protein [Nanoarchaeota archaeon]
MGSKKEFNWVLKLDKDDLENLVIYETRSFSKQGDRIFPLEPIFLVDDNWNVLASVNVIGYNYDSRNNKIEGEYFIKRLLN